MPAKHTLASLAAARALALLCAGCGAPPDATPPAMPADGAISDAPAAAPALFRVEDGWLLDAGGRAAILRGLNVSEASKRPDPVTGRFVPRWLDRVEWQRMAAWGMNSARFLIVWEAVEPDPGRYDEAYLDEIEAAIDDAAAAGLVVIIDMHQDLYTRCGFGGDGAPCWAVLDDGLAFEPSEPWWTNYIQPAVQRAFDSFWEDRDGVQARYAAAWAHVAARFGDHPAVAGYDVMNEPFPGSRIVDAGAADDLIYAPFWERVVAAIRAVDTRRPIFVEPNPMRTNVLAPDGFPSRLALPDGGEAGYAFAPHYYDPPVTQTNDWDGDVARLADAMDDLVAEAARLHAALWVGEWGLLLDQGNGPAYLDAQLGLMDDALAGWAYWNHNLDPDAMTTMDPAGNETWIVPHLTRAYPSRVAGTPVSMAFDPDARTLEVVFDDRDGAAGPTEIALPARLYPQGFEVEVAGEDGWTTEWDPGRSRLRVTTPRTGGRHTIAVGPR